jgi:hypothetical protein
MFIGVVGSTLASELVTYQPDRALTVAIFSYIFAGKFWYHWAHACADELGLGFFIGLLKLSVWMYKDMTSAKADPWVARGWGCSLQYSGTIPSYLISVGVPGFPALILMNLAQVIQSIGESQNFLSGLPGNVPIVESSRIFAVVSVLMTFGLLVSLNPHANSVMTHTDGAGYGQWVISRCGTLFDKTWHASLDVDRFFGVVDNSLLAGAQEVPLEAMAVCGYYSPTGRSIRADKQTWWSWTFPLSQLMLVRVKTKLIG